MKKTFKLTELDLTRLIKRIVNEQSTNQMQGNSISSPEEYGKAVFNVLKPNFQFSTSFQSNSFDSTGRIAPVPNTFATYYLQSLIGVSTFGKDGLRLEFNATCLNQSRRQIKGRLHIVIMFSKGTPTKLGPCFWLQSSSQVESLHEPDMERKILPIIQNIKYKY